MWRLGRIDKGALVREADRALYEAKETGKNKVVRSSDAQRPRVEENAKLASRIMRAN